MLIRPCYRVLKAINYLCDIADSHTTSCLDLIVYFHNHVKDLDLYATLQQLVSDEYITATFDEYICTDIAPTYKGKHFSDYRWLAIKDTLLKSFILPVLVALVTTLLTLALNGIFIVKP